MAETTLGQRIAALRKQRGLTQEEVAGRLGVSAQAVSKWENDQTCPDISLLPALADLLGVTTDTLLRGPQASETYVLPVRERKPLEELLLKIAFDTEDNDKVRVNLPLTLIKAATDVGVNPVNFSLSVNGKGNEATSFQNIDWEAVMNLARNGVMGKLIEIEAEGTHLSVWVE